MKNLLFILLLFVITGAYGQQTKVENNVLYKSVTLPKDDARFLALKGTAQKYMPQFIDSLQKHGNDTQGYRFVVKSDFVEGDTHEHMWSEVMGYSNGFFKAIFIDSPFTLKNIKLGDKIGIKETDIEDWAVENIRTKKITGEFSEKYLNSKP
ncbi:DUF2314 domain-containing protein [Mucilaginibacter lappiensis]|uniref:Uncharacterized protein YegJ (DUF2314 family) n=1 Tax=Mucilaginibacter lappiensis TaxID=354630 RepID=A0A841JER8_9SPHI|nr:DUF2314 domain-containing protein [Mucilaginibacter lappiensis]MBB6128076.1 uncharacterized protein YegJ (DUF2314 family) [Mucilaginibacter lappiensis]